MAVKTKKPPAKKAKAKQWYKPAIQAKATMNLDPKIIERSPFQPRQDFDAEKIAELGESMLVHGQAASICVRTMPGGGFQLLVGERRLRAAIAAGMSVIRADVFEADDVQARQIITAENLHREDLNKIEEAMGFQSLLEASAFSGPTALAESIGKSQSYVSNSLRLLTLPDFWKQKLISREITERHARAVLPYMDYAALPYLEYSGVLDALREAMIEETEANGVPTVSEWENQIIPAVLKDRSKPMVGSKDVEGQIWSEEAGCLVSIFTPCGYQRKELQIVEVAGEERALNVDLWEDLQQLHVTKLLKAEETKTCPRNCDTCKRTECNSDGAYPPGQAEREDAAAEEDEASDDANLQAATPEPSLNDRGAEATSDTFPARLWGWKIMATRKAIAEYIRDRADASEVLKIASLALTIWDCNDLHVGDLTDALQRVGTKRVKDPCKEALALQDWNSDKVLSHILAKVFWTEESGPSLAVPQSDVAEVAACMSIDLDGEWEMGRIASPQGYWDLHTKEQLLAIAKEVKLMSFLPGKPDLEELTFADLSAMRKSDLVATLMLTMPAAGSDAAGIPMPKEIAKAKAPKK